MFLWPVGGDMFGRFHLVASEYGLQICGYTFFCVRWDDKEYGFIAYLDHKYSKTYISLTLFGLSMIKLHTTESPLFIKHGLLVIMKTQWKNHQASMTPITRAQQLPQRAIDTNTYHNHPSWRIRYTSLVPRLEADTFPYDGSIHSSSVYCDSSWFGCLVLFQVSVYHASLEIQECFKTLGH